MTTFVLLAMLTAQAPAQVPPAQPVPPAPVAAPAAVDSYTYNPEGRRDPFVSLLRGGSDERGRAPGASGVDGISGLTVDEISVTGRGGRTKRLRRHGHGTGQQDLHRAG